MYHKIKHIDIANSLHCEMRRKEKKKGRKIRNMTRGAENIQTIIK